MAFKRVKEDGGWLVYDDENSEIFGRGRDALAAFEAAKEAAAKQDEAEEKQRIDAGTATEGNGRAAIEQYRDLFAEFYRANAEQIENIYSDCSEHIKDDVAQELEGHRQKVLGILNTPGLASALGLFDKDGAYRAIFCLVRILVNKPKDPHAYFEERRQEIEKYKTSINHIQSAIDIASTRSQPPGTLLTGEPPESAYYHLKEARDILQWELQNFMRGGASARGDLLGSKKGGHSPDGYSRKLMARSVLDNLPNELATPYKLTSDLMAAVGEEITPTQVRNAAGKQR